MSTDRILHPVDDAVGSSSCPAQSGRSFWMAHWMRTSSNLAAAKFSCAPNASEKEELDCGARNELDCGARNELKRLRPGEGLGVLETSSSKTLNSNSLLKTEILGNFGFGGSLSKQSREETCDRMLAPTPVMGNHFELGKGVDANTGFWFPNFPSEYDHNSSRRFKFLDEGSSEIPKGWMRKPSPEDRRFSASEPLQETFVGSSSHVPCKLDLEKFELHKRKSETYSLKGKGAVVSNQKLKKTNLGMLEEEAFKGISTPFLLNNHSTSDHHSPTFDQEFFQKMQKCSRIRLSPDRCVDSEKTQAEKSFYDCYSLDKLQNSVHNMETIRRQATLEEGITRDYPVFSQKSQSLSITKTTGVNLLNECSIFNMTTVIARVDGNTPSALHSASQFDNRGKGVVLQTLSSSTDSEVKGNPEQVKTFKFTGRDEPLTDADTVEFLKQNNQHSGPNYTLTDKVFGRDSSVSHRVDVSSSSRAAESQRPDTGLPGINLDKPTLQAAARLEENSGHSSSKTQSLDMDIFVAHAEKIPTPKSYIFPHDSPNSDPNNKWLRRLKSNSAQSSVQGIKNSNLAENSSEQKVKNCVNRMFESGTTGSESTARKHYSKEDSMVSETGGHLYKEQEEIAMDPLKRDKELLLSHAWIQRWLQDGSKIPQKNSGTMVVSKPHSSRLSVEELQQKQLPSIGAMALMGKAMKGFHPCDLQKKGSFTVWNAKNI